MATQKEKMKKVGFLNSASSGELAVPVAALRQGMKQAGFVEKKNVKVIYQYAKHDLKELPRLAGALVEAGVDVIAATGGLASAQAAVDAVKKSGKSIRVVYVSGLDPDNIDLPGGKATGVHTATTDCLPERLQYAAKLLGKRPVAMLVRPKTNVGDSERINFNRVKFDRGAQVLEADTVQDLEARFAEAKKKGLALVVSSDPFYTSRRKKILDLAKKCGVPAIYAWREYVDAGGLMSYGPSLSNAYRQAGVYVGQILSDATFQPPVLKPTCIEIAINLKTANALGVDVPGELLARAHHVVD